MSENGTKLETILKWIVLVIAALFAMKILFGAFAIAWLVGGFLLTRVLPLVVLVWLVLKAVEWWRTKNGTVPAEDNS